MVQNDEIISDESKVANSFSNFFENAIHSLGIKTNEYSNENYGLKKTVKIAIRKYEQHSSTNLIKENIKNDESFHVLRTKKESNLKEIINLVTKKNGTFLLAVSRMYQVSVAPFQRISGMRKFCLTKISRNLKLTNVSPIFKKKKKTSGENYRPEGVLPTVSKIFERIMQKLIYDYIGKFLSPI